MFELYIPHLTQKFTSHPSLSSKKGIFLAKEFMRDGQRRYIAAQIFAEERGIKGIKESLRKRERGLIVGTYTVVF